MRKGQKVAFMLDHRDILELGLIEDMVSSKVGVICIRIMNCGAHECMHQNRDSWSYKQDY